MIHLSRSTGNALQCVHCLTRESGHRTSSKLQYVFVVWVSGCMCVSVYVCPHVCVTKERSIIYTHESSCIMHCSPRDYHVSKSHPDSLFFLFSLEQWPHTDTNVNFRVSFLNETEDRRSQIVAGCRLGALISLSVFQRRDQWCHI